MAVLDWVVVAVLAASVLLGLWRGLVYEVLSVLNWLAAFVLAQWLAPRAAAMMPLSRAGESVQYAAGFVVVFIAALDFVGVPTTSLLAVVGAAGLAIGLALKDSLSNIASGVMLIALRPFRAGDTVQIAGLDGVVDSVRIFQTHMHSADNREIILPNSQITSSPIINFTGRGERRVDIDVPMALGDDFQAMRESLLALARQRADIRATPEPQAAITAVRDGMVTVQLRVWTSAADFGVVQAALFEAVLADYARRGAR